MAKHILDHERRRKSNKVAAYSSAARRASPEGSNPAVLAVMRRSKGPMNASLRNTAFLKIERGYSA